MMKKFLPVFLFLGCVVFAVAIYILGFSERIAREKRVYGLSGVIVEVTPEKIFFVTPTLPGVDTGFSEESEWLWQVETGWAFIVRFVATSSANFPGGFARIPARRTDLRAGMRATITSFTDIADQFSLQEKKINALEIRIHETTEEYLEKPDEMVRFSGLAAGTYRVRLRGQYGSSSDEHVLVLSADGDAEVIPDRNGSNPNPVVLRGETVVRICSDAGSITVRPYGKGDPALWNFHTFKTTATRVGEAGCPRVPSKSRDN